MQASRVGSVIVLLASLLAGMGVALAGANEAAPPRPVRLALLIGNAAYAGSPLGNPVNDVRDMAGLLKLAGFDVIVHENLGLREMHLALRDFGDRLKRESLGLFYFAGHGVQVRGRNYLLPVDADIGREDEVAFNALDLQAVLEKMDSARNHTNLIILDACRNNPFATRFQLGSRGLAQIDAPPGTLVAFATAPGAVADDGKGRNGLYTRFLLEHLAAPGARIEDGFKRVRTEVRTASKGRQTPWESTSLENELVLRPVAGPPPRSTPASAAAGLAASGPVPGGAALPPGAAPHFEVGDWWEWRITNHLSGEVRSVRRRIVAIRGDVVTYDNGTVRDRSGNTLREVVAGKARSFEPSSLSYVFPLRPGLAWRGKLVERGDSHVSELDASVKVTGEEAVDTPAFRHVKAIKLERQVTWKNRGTGKSGQTRFTYWYAAPFKGTIRSERTSTTSEGRVYVKESQELVALGVR